MFDLEIPLFSVRRDLVAGLGSAIRNLIAGLAALGKRVNLPYTTKERLNPEFLPWYENNASDLIVFEKYPLAPGGMAMRFIEETFYAQVRHRCTRILYPNYFLPPRLLGQKNDDSVIIHDCLHRVFPELASRKKVQWLDLNFRRSLDRADHVFLISEFERNQVAKYYGDRAAARCRVLYNSVDWSRYEQGVVRDEIVELAATPYILCVAHPYPHKNILKTLRAYSKLPNRCRDYNLILVGKISNPIMEFVNKEMPEALRTKVRLMGFLSDSDLGHLYRNASLYVSASSYEGFGMTAVEAMGFGVPVLVTRGTALPEVTLERANYCPDVPAPEVWSEAMAECLEHQKSAAEYITLAAEIRKKYAPVTVARTLLGTWPESNRSLR